MAGKDVVRVVNRCDNAKEDKHLDLSGCDLTQIPDAIYLLLRGTTLQSCNLSVNLLRSVASKFATKFASLTALNLSSNHLSRLPDAFQHMERLSVLDISHNHFTMLPAPVYHMASLSRFSAEKNVIKDVAVQDLKRLPSICELNFQENPLTFETYSQLLTFPEAVLILVTPQDPGIDAVD